jgi:hypothetical protein
MRIPKLGREQRLEGLRIGSGHGRDAGIVGRDNQRDPRVGLTGRGDRRPEPRGGDHPACGNVDQP